MRYILLTEFESPSSGLLSCKLRGLALEECSALQKALADLKISTSRIAIADLKREKDKNQDVKTLTEKEQFYDIEVDDAHGVLLLNMLNNCHDYIALSHSMVIEKSYIGGRNIQIQKTAWTLYKSTGITSSIVNL